MGFPALNPFNVGAAVIAQARGNHRTVAVQAMDRRANGKTAPDLGDARRQEALALLDQSTAGTVIDHHKSLRFEDIGDPVLAPVESALAGQKKGANQFAAEQGLEDLGVPARPDKGAAAACRHHLGGPDLGHHAAVPSELVECPAIRSISLVMLATV